MKNVRFILLSLALTLIVSSRIQAQLAIPTLDDVLERLKQLPDRAKIDSFLIIPNGYIGGVTDSVAVTNLCQEILRYGQATSDQHWEIAGLLGMNYIEFANENYQASISYADKAMPILEANKTMADLYLYAVNVKATCYSELRDSLNTVNTFKQGINWMLEQDLTEELPLETGRIYYNLSRHLYESSDALSALSYALLAKKYLDLSSSINGKAFARTLLGTIQKSFGENEAAVKNFLEAGDMYLQQGTPFDSLRGIVRLVEATDKLEEATSYKNMAKSIISKMGPSAPPRLTREYCFVLILFSETLSREGLQDKRKVVLQELLSYYPDDYVAQEIVIRARVNLADYYFQTGQFRMAKSLASRGIAEASRFGSEKYELMGKEVFAKSSANLGDYRAAYLNLSDAEELRGNLEKKGAPKNMMKTYLNYQFEAEKEVLSLQVENTAIRLQQQQTLLWGTGVGILLLSGLLFTSFQSYRTKERANEQLREQQQQLTIANGQLNRFSGTVSHDILSNLNLLLTRGELLADKKDNAPDLWHYYETTQAACLDLKYYCTDLLKVARSIEDLDKNDPNYCNGLLAQVLALYEPELKAANFHIESAELHPIAVPSVVIKQFFQNLLTNAIKYVPIPGRAPLLRFTSFLSPAGKVTWVIEDNGPDIATPSDGKAGKKTKVTNMITGAGVGLSLLKRQLAAYGVSLTLENREEGGLRVVLS